MILFSWNQNEKCSHPQQQGLSPEASSLQGPQARSECASWGPLMHGEGPAEPSGLGVEPASERSHWGLAPAVLSLTSPVGWKI